MSKAIPVDRWFVIRVPLHFLAEPGIFFSHGAGSRSANALQGGNHCKSYFWSRLLQPECAKNRRYRTKFFPWILPLKGVF